MKKKKICEINPVLINRINCIEIHKRSQQGAKFKMNQF